MYERVRIHMLGEESFDQLILKNNSAPITPRPTSSKVQSSIPAATKTGGEAVKMSQPKPTNKPPDKPHTFEVACALNYAKGMSRANAVKKAARDYPELHAEYLKRIRGGGDDHLRTLFEVSDNAIRRKYHTDPALQKEFGNVERYVAYSRAQLEGRITGRNKR